MTSISEELLKALESDDACDIGQIIKSRKQKDFEALQSLLSLDPSIKPEHRTKALYAIGRWSDPSPIAAIRGILPHLDEPGRISAIDTLGRLGTKEALSSIIGCINDPSPQVRKIVVSALGRINMPEARAKLKEIAAKDSVDYIRAHASKYLKPVL